jgi:raffinose/stachyose/melibiose transport system substrate-binding protein
MRNRFHRNRFQLTRDEGDGYEMRELQPITGKASGRHLLRTLLAVLALFAMATVAACGGDDDGDSGGSDANQEVKGGPLTVWLGGIMATATPGDPKRKWYDEQVAEFEKAYPGTKIKTVLMNPDGVKQTAAYRAAFGADKGPDFAMMYPGGFTTTFKSSLENLRDVAPGVVDQFPEQQLRYGCENFTCGDDAPVYLAPYDFSNWVLAYNKEIFDKVGVEAPFGSWDDLVAAGKKLKAAGYIPFQIGNRDGYVSDAYLSGMYTSYLTPDDVDALLAGELPLTDAKFVEPLRLWAKLYSDGLTNENACSLETLASQRAFFAEKAATVASFEYAHLYEELGDKVGVMAWPPIEGAPNADNAGPAAQVGQGWVVPKSDTVPLAAAFLAQVTSPEAQTKAFELAGTPPANPKTDTGSAPDTVSGAASDLFLDFKLLSLNTVLPLETQTTYFKETNQALCGNKSPEDAMQAVQDVFERERR